MRNLSIKRKLVLIIMFVSSAAMLLAGGAFVTYEWFAFRQRMVDDLSTQAQMVAYNCTGALSFDDPLDAAEVLESLEAKAPIAFACLYRDDGTVFATYQRSDFDPGEALPEPQRDGYRFDKGWLTLYRQISLDGLPIGTVCLKSDLREVSAFLRKSAMALAVMILLSSVVVYVLSSKLQKVVSGPVFHLAAVAGDVSRLQDYSIRATKESEDELGLLTDALNDMLAQVESRAAALRESEEKYRELFENESDAVIVFDAETWHCEDANRASLDLYGYSKEEFSGLTIEDISAEKEKTMVTVQEVKGQEFKGKRVPLRYFRKKDGEIFPGEVFIGTFMSAGRKKIIKAVRDISEQRRLESQLRQAHKMEAVGILAGGIAHDFNNILGIILGNTELAMRGIPGPNPVLERLEKVCEATIRAKDLVTQILRFSRQEEQALIPVNIGRIVKEGLKLMRSSIPTTIEIRQDISDDSGTVLADPTQIHQLLMNFCTNAAHAMEDAGGVLQVGLTCVELDEDAMRKFPELAPGSYVRLTMNDNGPGIDPRVIDRIFDPYFTTKGLGKGTGMGLAVVHGIVKNHGGAVSVDSAPGKGATFQVFLPKAGRQVVPETETFEALPTGNERILLIDDEKELLSAGHQMLEQLGYEVESRVSPVEALELFMEQPDKFDLVITDMTMPHMTGEMLAKAMMEIRPDIPIILCSGFSHRMNKEKASSMGISDFVMKPIVTSDLAKTIRYVLDKP